MWSATDHEPGFTLYSHIAHHTCCWWRGCGVLIFCGTPTPGPESFPTPTLGLIVWPDRILQDDLRELLTSSPTLTVFRNRLKTYHISFPDHFLPNCFRFLVLYQTWSSRDWSLGLETSRDPFLQVLVLVLVLEPLSLGLGLGLGTSDHEDSVFVTHEAWKLPMKRIYSHSGLLMRANRARMGDNMLSQLVYLRCKNKL